MKAKTIEMLTNLAGDRIHSEDRARKALADEASDMTRGLRAETIRKAMRAAAEAAPYRALMEDTSDSSPDELFLKLRSRLTRQLIRAHSSSSSCDLINLEDRMKWDGVRRFLEDTDFLVDMLEAPEPTEAPAPAAQPEPPVSKRRPTPAQRKALELIAQGKVRRSQFTLKDPIRISSLNGSIYADTFEVLRREGWAECDHSSSLFQGQAVSLTDAGRAALGA
jgi:hypothetical protein